MAVVATQNYKSSKLGIASDGWTAEESWTVTGTADKAEASAAAVQYGSPHPLNADMTVDDISVENKGGPFAWNVTAKYKFGKRGSGNKNPLADPPKINWEDTSETLLVDRDLRSAPITNAAGFPVDPPATQRVTYPVLVYKRAEPFFNVQKSIQYGNAVNTDALNILGAGGVDPGQCMCLSIKPGGEYTADAPYVYVVYRFEFRPGLNPFQSILANVGKEGWYKDAAGNLQPGPIVDASNNPPATDVRLFSTNGTPMNQKYKILGKDGQPHAAEPLTNATTPKLNPNLITDPTSTADIVYLLWITAKQMPFAPLSL